MTTNTAWSAASLPSKSVGPMLAELVASVKRSWARRRTHIILADLDDHTLDDIGLDPSHIRRTRPRAVDWVIQSNSGTARLVFIGR